MRSIAERKVLMEAARHEQPSVVRNLTELIDSFLGENDITARRLVFMKDEFNAKISNRMHEECDAVFLKCAAGISIGRVADAKIRVNSKSIQSTSRVHERNN